jgi:O-antigen ligase
MSLSNKNSTNIVMDKGQWLSWFFLLAITALGFYIFSTSLTFALFGLIIGAITVVLAVVRTPILALYSAVLLMPLQFGVYIQQAFGITLTPIVVVTLLMVVTLGAIILIKGSLRPIPFFIFLLLWLAFSFLSYLNSPHITDSTQGLWFLFRVMLVPVIIYPLFWQLSPTRNQLIKILTVFTIAVSFSSIIALIQTASGGHYLSGVFTNQRWFGLLFPFPPEIRDENPIMLQAHFYFNSIFRAHGAFYRANGFAAFLTLSIGIAWGLFRSTKGRLQYFFLACFFLQLSGLIVTFSRTAWMAFVVALPFGTLVEIFAGMKRGIPRKAVQLIILGLVLFLILFAVALHFSAVMERFQSILNPTEVAEVQWRISIWKDILENLRKNPFVGTGDAVATYIPTSLGLVGLGAHNFYLGVANQVGIPAALILLFFVAASLLKLWKAMRYPVDISLKVLASGVFVGWIGFLIVGLGTATYEIENIAVLFWLFIAISFWFRSRLCLTP